MAVLVVSGCVDLVVVGSPYYGFQVVLWRLLCSGLRCFCHGVWLFCP